MEMEEEGVIVLGSQMDFDAKFSVVEERLRVESRASDAIRL